jgi:hypothetical protein
MAVVADEATTLVDGLLTVCDRLEELVERLTEIAVAALDAQSAERSAA